MSDHETAIWQIFHTAARARRRDLLAAVVAHAGWTVQAGLFAGMTLPEQGSRDAGEKLPQLLGCYESELHPTLAEVIARTPDLVIVIGAAEGYYPVGLARVLPNAFVHAFELVPEARDVCRAAGTLNDVGGRLSVAGACTVELLAALLPRGRAPLVMSNCGGHERDLISPARIPALRTATLIVECHDHVDPAITNTVVDRLSQTHDLIGVTEAGRNPNDADLLTGLNSLDRWLAVCEFRPRSVQWLVAHPRT